jgi:hypothetical protein
MHTGRGRIMDIQFFTYNGQLVHFEKATLSEGNTFISLSVPHSLQAYHNLIMKLKTPDGKYFSKKMIFSH